VHTHEKSVIEAHPPACAAEVTHMRIHGLIPSVLVGAAVSSVVLVAPLEVSVGLALCALTATVATRAKRDKCFVKYMMDDEG